MDQATGARRINRSGITLKAGGTDYIPWKTATLVTLRMEEYAYEVVTGTLKKPTVPADKTPTTEEEEKIKNFNKGNKSAQTIIVNSLDAVIIPEIYKSLDLDTVSAETIWKNIEEYCTENQGASTKVGYDQLISFKFDTKIPATDNLARFRNIIETIKLSGTTPPNELINSCLLRSLPDGWEGFKQATSVLSYMGYDALMSAVNAEALRRSEYDKMNHLETLFSSMSTRQNKRNFRRWPHNTNHREFGHSSQQRPQNKPWHQRNNVSSGTIKCFKCGKMGHVQNECRSGNWSQAKPRTRREAHNAEFLEVNLADGHDEERLAWIVDSGCTNHMAKDLNVFKDYRPFEPSERKMIKVGGNQHLAAHGIGTVVLNTTDGQCILYNVLYTPKMRRNLVSVPKVTDFGWDVRCRSKAITMTKGDVTLIAKRSGDLFSLQTISESEPETLIAEEPATLQQFHELLAHMGKHKVKEFLTQLQVKYSPDESNECEPCMRGKQTRASYRQKPDHAKAQTIGRITTDLCSPSEPAIGDYHHLMCINDEYSKFRRAYILKQKSDAAEGI